jgi:Lrp/AsnC family leucine-responsive transcriptional regulator
MENLDSTDLQILKHLQEDSNINIKDLASVVFNSNLFMNV